MLVSANRSLARRTREGFTLLEVLVVVAIIVILAGVAGVAMFRYIDDARTDTARNQMTIFENACRDYMAKNEGNPPPSLEALVAPPEGAGKPFVDGGNQALINPWGKAYTYDGAHMDAYGSPDPVVSTLDEGNQNKMIFSTKRKTAPY